MLYTILGVLGDVLSVIFISFVCLFVLAALLYRALGRPVKPVVGKEKMPLLRPIPIPTKNQSFIIKPLVWLFEVRKWSLEEHWRFDFHDGTGDVRFVLHKGFEFDGASIPRLFWFFLSPIGLQLIPAILHDYAYKYNQLWEIDDGAVKPYGKGSRKRRWDRLFWEVGRQVNGIWILNSIAWLAIILGGWRAWNKHRDAQSEPVMPVLDELGAPV